MIEIIFARYFSFSCPFFFYSPRSGLCCKPKYRANIIHHFIFVFFLYFFYHSSCRKKDQFPVSSFKFGTQVFTDPGLLKIWRTLTGLPWLWFCLPKCICSETSLEVRLQVIFAPCWVGTLPLVLLGVRNINFSKHSLKILKMGSERFIHALLLFYGLFLKFPLWVPLIFMTCKQVAISK